MASGRQDYWYGMLPGKAGLGGGQTAWYEYGYESLPALTPGKILEYTVPDGYVLNLNAGIISCECPGIQMCYLKINDAVIWAVRFDSVQMFPFNQGGSHIFQPGDKLEVFGWNNEEVTCEFSVTLLGFLQQK